MINTIILAGSQSIKKWSNSGNKALFNINGKTMAEYVIDAVKKVDAIGKIVIVGPKSEVENRLGGKVDAVLDSNGSIMDNLLIGVRYLGFNDYVLVCSSDIPLITSEAINDFITKSKATQADLCYPIIEKKVNDGKYPEADRTYVKLKEGSFTGGNIFYVKPKIVEERFDQAEKLLKYRKSPLKMAQVLSFGFMMQLMAGNMELSKVEKKFSDILKINAKAVITEYPEIGNDVDKPGDLIVATAHLSK